MELYVYYRLKPAQQAGALQAFESACQGLNAPWPRLLCRQDEAPDAALEVNPADHLQTWMEVYTGSQARQAEARVAAALQPLIEGARHVECFAPLAGLRAI